MVYYFLLLSECSSDLTSVTEGPKDKSTVGPSEGKGKSRRCSEYKKLIESIKFHL